MTGTVISRVSAERLRRDLLHLSRDPLPFRKVNFTRAGRTSSSLDETDDYLCGQLERCGYTVRKTPHEVQAFRCDASKPLHHWYSAPDPADPWHTANNLEVTKPGGTCPEQIIQLVSHKDSMSWIDSPGAHDNACGTVANLEIARILADRELRRSVRILFCNEEHTPWTSHFAAAAAAARGDDIVAVLNQDSLAGKSDEDRARGALTHVVGYSTPEGQELAQRFPAANTRYDIGLAVDVVSKERVNDDDGMFIKAGFARTVMNVGSFPYADAEYHLVGDTAERVDIENLTRSTQLVLAVVLELAREE